MGNTINKESNDTINWKNVNTEQFSDSFDKKLNGDANLLITRLNIPSVETDTVSDIENIFSKYQTIINNTNVPKEPKENSSELSDTSPFISSEMYNFLINKSSSPKKQVGGATKMEGDDSSTSSTSSSSETLNKKKTTDKKPKNKTSKNSDLEYVSSSAHTEDHTSDENNDSTNENEISSNENTTQTGGSISNNNEDLPPSSINTSDINMITESS